MPFVSYYQPPERPEGCVKKRMRFWIKSNRGTDEYEDFWMPADMDDDALRAEVAEWCEQFGAWHHSNNVVSYGWDTLPPNPRTRAIRSRRKRQHKTRGK